MAAEDEPRRWYNIGARKIAHADRDVARSVFGDRDQGRFYNILGADTVDDDSRFPPGCHTTYSAHLSAAEAARFADASNCRYVEPDQAMRVHDAGHVPDTASRTFLGQAFTGTEKWHGQDVTAAVLDEGTTAAVRAYMGFTLVARKVFTTDDLAGAEIYPGNVHGCLVAPNLVPRYGRLLDALVVNAAGDAFISASCAAIPWAVDNGARVINMSIGNGFTPCGQAFEDALTYMSRFDCELYTSAGNDSVAALAYPAAYCTTYPKVHAVIAWDPLTGARASFSNYAATAACIAPGNNVTSLSETAVETTWYGTSAASPLAAQCCVRLQTGRRFTARDAYLALQASATDLGLGAGQGGGAYNLSAAITALGGFSTPTRPNPRPWSARAGAAMPLF